MPLEVSLLAILIVIMLIALWALTRRLDELQQDQRTYRPVFPRRDNIESEPLIIHPPRLHEIVQRRVTIMPPPNPAAAPIPKVSQVPKKKIRNVRETKKHFHDLQEHGNDSQNTHDHQIQKYLTRKYNRMVELAANDKTDTSNNLGLSEAEFQKLQINTTFLEIHQELKRYAATLGDKGPIYQARGQMALEEISKGGILLSFGPAISEPMILTRVWLRINHPDNKDNHQAMVIALLDQLVNCVEKHKNAQDPGVEMLMRMIAGPAAVPQHQELPDTVENVPQNYTTACINGRTGRIISSLTLQDVDAILREPEKDGKEVANEAYYKANNIFNKEIKEYPMPKDMKPMAVLYNTMEDKLTSEELEEVKSFVEHTKKQIEIVLKHEYKNIVDKHELETIIRNAQAGVA